LGDAPELIRNTLITLRCAKTDSRSAETDLRSTGLFDVRQNG